MTAQEFDSSGATASTPAPRRRVLIAVAGGLIAMVVALGALVVDLSAASVQLQSQIDEDRATINALTKQLYWAQQQLGQSP